jgi:TonB family protein
MKSCPRCGKEYPDSEGFCEVDGTALVTAGGVIPRAPGAVEDSESAAQSIGVTECPVCGGKAQPGEVICNFCGTRLLPDSESDAGTEASANAPTAQGRRETFALPDERQGPVEMGSPDETKFDQEPTAGRRAVGVLGFSIAAIVALAAGAWFAIYLSGRRPAQQPVAGVSPSPAVSSGPVVALARTIPIQVQGDLAGTLSRDKDALRKVFDDNQPGLADVYGHALESDATLHDGMVVRLHINPDGSVASGSVRVSTLPNPSLDAEAVKAMSAWKFAAAKGTGVDADYPVVFANRSADIAGIESDLNAKLASLAPNEPAEYALAPSAAPIAAPSEASTPALASAPAEAPPAVVAPETPPPRRHKRPPRIVASARPPTTMSKPPLVDRVYGELRANRKLRRVQVYTNGGTVNLAGKVFNDDDKLLAERTVRGVDGVTAVVDNLRTDMQDWTQKQARISQELQNAGLDGVTVKVIGHDAYLNGEVKTDLDRQRAVTIAQAAAPVVVRENLIRVAPGRVFGF